jgi:transcription initiation factor TFIIA large subunit
MPHQRNGGGQSGGMSFPPPSNQPVGVKAEPGVKVEPGLDNAPQVPLMNSTSNTAVQARVINNLQTAFGDRATVTVQKLQETMGPVSNNNAQYPGQQRPGGPPMQQQPHSQYQAAQAQAQAQAHQQYRQQLAAGQAQQRMAPHPQAAQNGQKPAASQMDGSAEDSYSGVLMRQDASGHTTELGRVEIDRLLHAQIEARAKSMEGGGLMLPLKRKVKQNPVSYHRAQANAGPARFDGGDDDIKSEDDNDAINSDLDDSDENQEEDDEDEDGGQMMLCMYDKVQRVKNKW